MNTRVPALSPSRSNDYLQCPLMFRFRTIDKLPEPPSKAAAKGTLVHWVLEHLYDEPLGKRSPAVAHGLVPAALAAVKARSSDFESMFVDGADRSAWLDQAGTLIDRYFKVEDPNRLEPAEREVNISAVLDGSFRIKGIVDRVDVAPNGAVRIVDYKTGKSPRPQYGASAAFQTSRPLKNSIVGVRRLSRCGTTSGETQSGMNGVRKRRSCVIGVRSRACAQHLGVPPQILSPALVLGCGWSHLRCSMPPAQPVYSCKDAAFRPCRSRPCRRASEHQELTV